MMLQNWFRVVIISNVAELNFGSEKRASNNKFTFTVFIKTLHEGLNKNQAKLIHLTLNKLGVYVYSGFSLL